MKKTMQIETNKNLSIDFSEWKQNVTKKRYDYFDFDKEKVSMIAEKDIRNELSLPEARVLVQALFPQYLICSGLIDCFLIFEIKDGVRIDPPKYYYQNLYSFLNNDSESKVNRLLEEIKDLFEQSGIKYSESWESAFGNVV